MTGKIVKSIAFIGLLLIIAAVAAVVFTLIFQSTVNVAARDSFITAFGGAGFAYLFVKIGELFTRLRDREKLDQDTLVSLEYMLNTHLNDLGGNSSTAQAMIDALQSSSSFVLNYMEFSPIHRPTIRLQDLKNVDLINESFGYLADVDKIEQSLAQLQKFTDRLNKQALDVQAQVGTIKPADVTTIASVFTANKDEFINQLSMVKSFVDEADKDALNLIAKVRYLEHHPSLLLALPIPWATTRRYNHRRMDPEIEKLRKQLKAEIDENVKASIKKIDQVKKSRNA